LLPGPTAGGDHRSQWYAAIGRRRRDLRSAGLALLATDGKGAAELTLALSMYAAECGDLSGDGGLLDSALASITADREASPQLVLLLRGYALRRRVEAVDPTTDTARLAADLDAAVCEAQELGDPRVTLTLLDHSVRSARTIGHYEQAERHAAEAAGIAAAAGFPAAETEFEMLGSIIANAQRRFDTAAALAVRAHIRARQLDLPLVVAQAALMFRQLPAGTPNLPRVLPTARDVLDLLEGRTGERSSIAVCYGVADWCLFTNDVPMAARATRIGLRTADSLGLPAGVGTGIMLVVALAVRAGETIIAARLHGALAIHLDVLRHSITSRQKAWYDAAIDAVRDGLGEEVFARESGRGASWRRHAVVEEALHLADSLAGQDPAIMEPGPAQSQDRPRLTRRELEVLNLLAAGLSNKDIALQLGMTPKTTMHHTSNIYRKLGVRGRGEAAAWARRTGIA
jgi:DNA-binding CsgD family transcriptional regulator